MNNVHSFFSSLCHSPLPRRAAVMLAALLVLAWSSLALCDEIHDAAQSGDLAKVKVLLKDMPDLVFSKNENSMTPLFLAAFYGHKDVVELLIANKAEVNAKTNEGGTPLHAAALKGHKDVVELLIANKAEVNAKDIHNVTPLHMAALGGHKDVVELLIANKAGVNAKANDGVTPLRIAAQNDYKDVAELLRQRGGHE